MLADIRTPCTACSMQKESPQIAGFPPANSEQSLLSARRFHMPTTLAYGDTALQQKTADLSHQRSTPPHLPVAHAMERLQSDGFS